MGRRQDAPSAQNTDRIGYLGGGEVEGERRRRKDGRTGGREDGREGWREGKGANFGRKREGRSEKIKEGNG